VLQNQQQKQNQASKFIELIDDKVKGKHHQLSGAPGFSGLAFFYNMKGFN
jgi:hypothetical protein